MTTILNIIQRSLLAPHEAYSYVISQPAFRTLCNCRQGKLEIGVHGLESTPYGVAYSSE